MTKRTGLLYALTGPSVNVARWLYGVYVASRTVYPILYIRGIQPFRSFAFTIPFVIQVHPDVVLRDLANYDEFYMAYVVIQHVYTHI